MALQDIILAKGVYLILIHRKSVKELAWAAQVKSPQDRYTVGFAAI